MTVAAPASRAERLPRGHFLDALRDTFARQATRTAVVFDDRPETYGELDARARRVASQLQTLGVEAGDRVALVTAEKRPFLAAHLGTLYAGAVALPLNPRFTRDELRYFLDDSGASVAVVGASQRPVVESLRDELPDLRAVVLDVEMADAPASASSYRDPAPGADDPCLLLYSSGTTGEPKGVVHTHANLASSLHALRDCWRIHPDDVIVHALPLFHIHGLSFAAQLGLLSGACLRFEETFHPRRTLEAIGRGTVFMAIPTFYYAFLERPEFVAEARRWGDVRLFTCGSSPIRPEVLPTLEETLGRPVVNRYGMTESHVIASLPLDGPWPQGSVGTPLSGVELRVNREDGTPCDPGEVGTVVLRGPNLFREYWRRPEATRAAFAGGWFDTGDLGSLDAGGFLTLAGRKNELIITNGFNVYPPVVEKVIDACPGVRESAVLGLPDARRGERVAAVVVRDDPTLSEKALRAYWSERLVDYQRPHALSFVDSLPRNAMGKVLRRELRKRFEGSS